MEFTVKKVEEIVKVIKDLLPNRRPIEHHEPFIRKDLAASTISHTIDEGITGYHYVDKFADCIREITKAEQVILTSSGTSALEIALRALDIKPNEEVLVPSSTFVATANTVSNIGAVPHFIDGTPTLRAFKLRQYLAKNTVPVENGRMYLTDHYRDESNRRKISALIVVHLFGLPADMEGLCKVAKEFNLKIIEDAAQAFGSTINGKHCGTFGDIGIYSFNNNKIVTTNGGGAIITNDPWLASRSYQLSTTSRIPHKWFIDHDAIAYNYRMGNINAALGYSQLVDHKGKDIFQETLASKRALAMRYRHKLKDLVQFVEPTIESEPNYWLNTILVDNRDALLTFLHSEGIRARAVFTPLHRLPMYKDHPRSDSIMNSSDNLFNRGVCLPSGYNL